MDVLIRAQLIKVVCILAPHPGLHLEGLFRALWGCKLLHQKRLHNAVAPACLSMQRKQRQGDGAPHGWCLMGSADQGGMLPGHPLHGLKLGGLLRVLAQ